MERYQSLGLLGEGSYGSVLKCRHRDSGRLVAIKKFVDSDDDKTVKKIALREIKLLRHLRHVNLVDLLEVWRRRRRWYLVFEFVERTLLDDLELHRGGLDLDTSRQYLYQVLRATAFCHQQNIIHRDIKPENVLISQGGVVKLCDFGFARTLVGDVFTDYVSTRWYRAPELLVGDIRYGKPVDVWAVGCLLLEMFTGQPLFPGDSDLDQIHHITRCFGHLTARHQELFYRNPVFSGVRLPECYGQVLLSQRFPTVPPAAVDLAQSCLQMDPERRAHCSELLEHPLFTQDSFHLRFLNELNAKIQKDHRENSNLPRLTKTPRRQKEERNEQNQRSKKQLEEVSEKVYKEMEKKDNKEEEKTEKTKRRAKFCKTTRNTSEPSRSNKQSRAFTGKAFQNAARASVAMKSKTGKSTGAGSRKEFTKSEKTSTTDSSVVRVLKDNNSETEEPQHETDAPPEPREDHLQSTKKKQDGHSTGFYSSCTGTAVSSERNEMDICRSSKSKSSQEYMKKSWNSPNLRVPQMSKSSTTDHVSSSLTSFHQTAPEAGQPSGSDHTEASSRTTPAVTKPCQGLHSSEHLNNQLTSERTTTSECSKVSSSGPEMTRTNTSVSINPSGPPTSDLKEASPAHSTVTPPRGISNPRLHKADSTSTAKPSEDTTCAPNKPSEDLPEDKDLVEVLIETQNQLGSFKTEVHKYLKTSPTKRAAGDHMLISINQDPEPSEFCSVHLQSPSRSKISSESRTPSDPTLSEIQKANTSILKTLKICGKENRDDSGSVSGTTRSSGDETSEPSGISSHTEKKKSNRVKSDVTSFRVPHSKSMIEQSQAKLWCFGNNTSTAAVRETRDNERKDSVSTGSESTSVPSTSTPDHKAPKRSFVLHSMDPADILHSSPPPPPPSSTPLLLPPSSTPLLLPLSSTPQLLPLSSTPLLLPPSSTPLVPSVSWLVSDHLRLGTALRDGNPGLRSVDIMKPRGGVCSRRVEPSQWRHVPASLTSKVSGHTGISERLLVDRCSSSGVVLNRKKSDVRFPDLRNSRGRDGKHNHGVTTETRTDMVSPSGGHLDRKDNQPPRPS
ncbi:cyclin-dependent kinase-like 5 [Platichthys flesus]|uniref:cyclin-dependent kinase-like 5 n=1 Tax=Platichthys flesus TaxID=8260 RepID=UPI002DBD394C|nr:cyclin-dependent kinase-like 5 [Platichthys flesus]